MFELFKPPQPQAVPVGDQTYVIIPIASGTTPEQRQAIRDCWSLVFNDNDSVHFQLVVFRIDGLPETVFQEIKETP